MDGFIRSGDEQTKVSGDNRLSAALLPGIEYLKKIENSERNTHHNTSPPDALILAIIIRSPPCRKKNLC